MKKHWKDVNFNKWGKDMPDCAVRAIVAAIGIDYEVACKVLGVKCVKGKGFTDTYGVDIDTVQEKFSAYLGDVEENEGFEDDPLAAFFNAPELDDWLEEMKSSKKTGTYLVYVDDNKKNDGGHIICCEVTSSKAYFIDTSDVGGMQVQCWMKVLEKLDPADPLHYKMKNPLDKAV